MAATTIFLFPKATAEEKTMMLVFGAILTPFGGPYHAKQGRLAIYQELIPELDSSVSRDEVVSRLFGPKEVLENLRGKLNLGYDSDYEEPCLLFQGDSGALLAVLEKEIPGLELVNVDNDEERDKLTTIDVAAELAKPVQLFVEVEKLLAQVVSGEDVVPQVRCAPPGTVVLGDATLKMKQLYKRWVMLEGNRQLGAQELLLRAVHTALSYEVGNHFNHWGAHIGIDSYWRVYANK